MHDVLRSPSSLPSIRTSASEWRMHSIRKHRCALYRTNTTACTLWIVCVGRWSFSSSLRRRTCLCAEYSGRFAAATLRVFGYLAPKQESALATMEAVRRGLDGL